MPENEVIDPHQAQNELELVEGRRLGRLPVKSSRKALNFTDFVQYVDVPETQRFWRKRAPFPLRTYGNDTWGNCTIAKQAHAITRMERLEVGRAPMITDEEVARVYFNMSDRLYGGGDNGAYETDALDNWRNPEYTLRDTKGNPHTIDGYLRLNPFNHREIRAALALSGARGIAVCFNLPRAWEREDLVWDGPPEGTSLTGKWMPGSWGGHSMWEFGDYDEKGGFLDQTWPGMKPTMATWRGKAIYMDEAHMVIDSVNAWRKRAAEAGNKKLRQAFGNFADAVNAISSVRIKVD